MTCDHSDGIKLRLHPDEIFIPGAHEETIQLLARAGVVLSYDGKANQIAIKVDQAKLRNVTLRGGRHRMTIKGGSGSIGQLTFFDVLTLQNAGKSTAEIMEALHVSRATFYRRFKPMRSSVAAYVVKHQIQPDELLSDAQAVAWLKRMVF